MVSTLLCNATMGIGILVCLSVVPLAVGQESFYGPKIDVSGEKQFLESVQVALAGCSYISPQDREAVLEQIKGRLGLTDNPVPLSAMSARRREILSATVGHFLAQFPHDDWGTEMQRQAALARLSRELCAFVNTPAFVLSDRTAVEKQIEAITEAALAPLLTELGAAVPEVDTTQLASGLRQRLRRETAMHMEDDRSPLLKRTIPDADLQALVTKVRSTAKAAAARSIRPVAPVLGEWQKLPPAERAPYLTKRMNFLTAVLADSVRVEVFNALREASQRAFPDDWQRLQEGLGRCPRLDESLQQRASEETGAIHQKLVEKERERLREQWEAIQELIKEKRAPAGPEGGRVSLDEPGWGRTRLVAGFVSLVALVLFLLTGFPRRKVTRAPGP